MSGSSRDVFPARDVFMDIVAQYFVADGWTDERMDQLYRACVAAMGSADRRAALVPLFDRENAGIVHGLSWWEERTVAVTTGRRTGAVTDADILAMMLAVDSRVADRPDARIYRPGWLCGAWRCVGLSRDGVHYVPPERARRWTLAADGALDTGAEARVPADTRWRIHEQGGPCLWLQHPGRAPDADVIVLKRTGDDGMIMSDPRSPERRSQWQRQ